LTPSRTKDVVAGSTLTDGARASAVKSQAGSKLIDSLIRKLNFVKAKHKPEHCRCFATMTYPMTLKLKHDLDNLMMYLHTEIEVLSTIKRYSLR